MTAARRKKTDRRCVTCDCKMSVSNTDIQCRPCRGVRPLGVSERSRLSVEVQAAEEAREAQRRFLREQEELEKREGEAPPEEEE